MAKLGVVLDRLIREATRVDPDFTIRPETPDRIAAAERCMGESLPDGYREFLEQIGRTRWPVVIGNVVDHRSAQVPTRFVPFGKRSDHAFDIAVFVRKKPVNPESQQTLRSDVSERVTDRRARLAALQKEKADEEDIGELQREIDELEDELEELDEKPISRPGATKHLPIEWCEAESGTLADAPRWNRDGPWEPAHAAAEERVSPCAFVDWLDRLITQAVVPPSIRGPAPSVDEESSRTRQLLELLVETGGIEVVDGFDEGAAALALAPLYGDSERFHAALLEVEGVEEVFISEDDLEIRFDVDAPGSTR